jgi:hypothetical protein
MTVGCNINLTLIVSVEVLETAIGRVGRWCEVVVSLLGRSGLEKRIVCCWKTLPNRTLKNMTESTRFMLR